MARAPKVPGTSFLLPPELPCACHVWVSETGQSMTERLPENLTEAEVVDQPEVGGSENEGDGASEVDRWEDEGGHDRAG